MQKKQHAQMSQEDIDAQWATRPTPNKKKATAYALIRVREFDQQAREYLRAMRLPIAIIAIALTSSCVSLKKYKALENAYQKAGHLLREAEQDAKMWRIEIQNAKRDTL